MELRRHFTDHPATVGESYLEHMKVASGFARTLAKATVAGAGALAETADESPEQLRINVTSPNGTTQAGLDVLMKPRSGLKALINKTVAAATERSKELSDD